jgi:hypothetical protein
MNTVTPEQKIHQKIAVLYNGPIHEFAYHPEERAGALLEQARRVFHITVNPHLMGLFDSDGRELVDDETLSQNKVKAGDELILRQSIVRGG